MLKHGFLYCTMNEFTAIMKKISTSGIKSADFQIRIAEKTHDPPLLTVWKVNDPPHMHSLKSSDPLYSATPLSAEIYEQSLTGCYSRAIDDTPYD